MYPNRDKPGGRGLAMLVGPADAGASPVERALRPTGSTRKAILMRLQVLLGLMLGLLMLSSTVVHAQQPGVDCAPIQGQGWSGCAPINPSQQPSQGPTQTPQPPPRWADRWGAIATYDANGSFGAATDMPSKIQAEQAALADCRSKKGSTCKVEIAYYNQCAAMVVGDKMHNAGSAPTVDKVVKLGINVCKNSGDTNCRVYYSACSMPQRIQ